MPPRKKAAAPKRSVLIIGSEAVPFAKTGGLADVLGALPAALARLGWMVTVALPRYRGVQDGTLVERFPVTVGGVTADVGFFEAPIADGARALLVDCPELYDRETLYGPAASDYPDNPRRFAVLVRAALEFAARRGSGPTIVHAHDWQAGLAPVYLKTLYAAHPVLGGTPSVFTIHNLAYQGTCEADWLPRLDLPWKLFTIEQLEYWGRISLLKGGINNAEIITTVSRTLRRGDSDAGVRRRIRRHPAAAIRGSGRHPERHRRGAVGSVARSVPARAVQRGASRRKGRVQARGARAVRSAGERRHHAAAARRHDLAHGRSKGIRPDRRGRRRAPAPRCHVRRPRHRGGALSAAVDGAGGGASRSHRRAHRLRRAARASHRRRAPTSF